MKPPGFWMRDGVLPRLLGPAGHAVAAVARARSKRVPAQAGVPVICCGGVTVGGAGKTTLALDLGARLNARLNADGRACGMAFLTRGYGGTAHGPLQVDPTRHDAALVGDEALLLAACAPCWVARDRAAGARAAVAGGARVLVMDDGLQNPSLAKDLSLLTIDGATGFGNGRVMPAGPLRETIRHAAARTQAAVLIGADRTGALRLLPPDLPVLRASLRPDGALQGWRVFALTGIAIPGKFHAGLQDAGAQLAGHAAFADHHAFSAAQIETVLARAAALDARPVTTPKDAVRIPQALRSRFTVLGTRLVWEQPDQIGRLLGALC